MNQMCQHGLMKLGRISQGLGKLLDRFVVAQRRLSFHGSQLAQFWVTCGQDIGHVLPLALQWRDRWMARYFVGCEF
jgi:hypothetical protein